MTNSKPLILCFFLQAILVMVSVPAISHSRGLEPNDENMIENVCKKTPNYRVCVESLKGYPGSAGADIPGLARIMVNVMKAKANDGLKKIHELQRKGVGPKEKRALRSCADKYRAIIVADVAQASAALPGDPKFAEDGANDAANEATFCEKNFSGNSPLTQQNNAMHDVSAVTAAIVRLLL